MAETQCYTCRQNANRAKLPVRDRVFDDGVWRVAHAFDSALQGWLVVVPLRHTTGLHELNEAEELGLGPLLRRLTAALVSVTGCRKTYVILLAEAPGFEHVHFHVVPRAPELPSGLRGTGIFEYLKRPKEEQLPAQEMDKVGAEIARLLEAQERGM